NKLIQKLKDEGVKFYFSENTKSVKPNAQRFIVETESGKMIETDYVLDATGRKPNVQQIGLEKVGILFSDRGIEVDDYLRTNVKN
ncbi:FAD-dependent oxidoreductase, partial [Staphylococcus aureus]